MAGRTAVQARHPRIRSKQAKTRLRAVIVAPGAAHRFESDCLRTETGWLSRQSRFCQIKCESPVYYRSISRKVEHIEQIPDRGLIRGHIGI